MFMGVYIMPKPRRRHLHGLAGIYIYAWALRCSSYEDGLARASDVGRAMIRYPRLFVSTGSGTGYRRDWERPRGRLAPMLIHMGHIVEAEYRRLHGECSGCTVTWLAAQMNCDRRNIHDIFHRPSIDSQLLVRLSKVMRHNFFADIAAIVEKELLSLPPLATPERLQET